MDIFTDYRMFYPAGLQLFFFICFEIILFALSYRVKNIQAYLYISINLTLPFGFFLNYSSKSPCRLFFCLNLYSFAISFLLQFSIFYLFLFLQTFIVVCRPGTLDQDLCTLNFTINVLCLQKEQKTKWRTTTCQWQSSLMFLRGKNSSKSFNLTKAYC